MKLAKRKFWTVRFIALACAFVTGIANAQSIAEVPIADVPDLAKQLEIREPLYPSGGINSNGALGIGAANYANLTDRYGHNIFANAHEYTTLQVTSDGVEHEITLDSDVFEDTYPLIYDLDDDTRGEIITVQSSQTGGGSIAVYGVRDGALKRIAQTPNIGTRNRWMNVAGIADFNGDGQIEIALVDRPHIRGELEFWTYTKDETFELRTSALGFSNHFIGSSAQRLSHVVIRGNQTPLLALPSTNRRALHLVDASGDIKIVASAELPAPIAENFATAVSDTQDFVGLLLADGSMKAFAISP